jgi:hypothetical protein
MRERDRGLWTELNWHVLVAELGRRLVGVATGSYVGTPNIGVIGYIAVARGRRSRGLGPRLRRRLRALFERDARGVHENGLAALVGEVRIDNAWLYHLVRREGAIALDFPYYQPSLRGRRDPVPLVLYYQPLRRRRRSLPVAEVRRLLYPLWRRPYRVGRPLTRAPFRRMLRALVGRQRIGQRTLGQPSPRSRQDVE